jgi:hypothetical protein
LVVPEQAGPLPQVAPSATLDHAEVVAVGLQAWHTFDELVAPLPTSVPSIQHPVWQVPLLHTCPTPQIEPLTAVVHDVTDWAFWQTWQAFAWLAAPVA